MKLNLKLLQKLGACAEAKEVYEKRQETDVAAATRLLIDGCEECEDVKVGGRLSWANWLVTKVMSHENKIRYAIFAAEQVIEIFEKEYPYDKRPRKAIEAAKKYLDGEVTAADSAYAAAHAAAHAAAYAADAAVHAVHAAYAAYAASAAYAAANAAVHAANAANAADAAYAAVHAAYAADAANAADADTDMLTRIIEYGITLIEKEDN